MLKTAENWMGVRFLVNILSLSDLPVGKTVVVEEILLSGAMRLRLMELGLVPGTRVRCVHRAPSGSPGAYAVRGAVIAIRKSDAVRILTEPKNALVKQYKKLLEYDDVDLEFTEDALNAIADKAIERNIGARGLRAVMEGLLTKVMYEIPSDETVVKAVVTKECVEGTAEPELTHDPNKINYSVKLNPGRSESRSESGTPKSAS